MCNRYAHRHTPEEMRAFFAVALHPGLARHLLLPNYNIAPQDKVPAVRQVDGRRGLTGLTWGFDGHDHLVLNARSETARQKTVFRESLKLRRCLLPASGFFEWSHEERPPQPYYFQARDEGLLALGAIWAADETVCILTTSANATVAPIHDRMPVLIRPPDFDRWLGAEGDIGDLLRPAAEEILKVHPVGKRVNRVGEQGGELLEPVKVEARRQGELF